MSYSIVSLPFVSSYETLIFCIFWVNSKAVMWANSWYWDQCHHLLYDRKSFFLYAIIPRSDIYFAALVKLERKGECFRFRENLYSKVLGYLSARPAKLLLWIQLTTGRRKCTQTYRPMTLTPESNLYRKIEKKMKDWSTADWPCALFTFLTGRRHTLMEKEWLAAGARA